MKFVFGWAVGIALFIYALGMFNEAQDKFVAKCNMYHGQVEGAFPKYSCVGPDGVKVFKN